MPQDRSSLGWSPPDRAPRLRRAADLLIKLADKNASPNRVRRLARDMRLRATEVELGLYASDEFEELLDFVGELGKPIRGSRA